MEIHSIITGLVVWGALIARMPECGHNQKKKPSPQMLIKMRTYLLYILYILGVRNLFQQLNLPNYMYNVRYSHGETVAY